MPPGSALLNGKPLGTTNLGDFAKAGPHPQPPTKIWGDKPAAPLPTNRWWVNLVLPDGDDKGVGENVVSPLPYLVKVLADGLHACLPKEDAAEMYVALPFEDTVALGAKELTKSASHSVKAHDLLSVTIEWSPSDSGGSSSTMVTPLVRGMPYVTAIYTQLTPTVGFATSPIQAVNGKKLSGPSTVHGSRFEVHLASGQMWILYAERPVDINFDGPSLQFAAKYDGVVRMAAAPTPDAAAVLDAYATRVPKGGDVHADAHGDRAVLAFDFTAQGKGDLLMLALPHHLDVGHLSRVARTELKYTTLKGDMVGVVGDTWAVNERLPALEWGAPRPIASDRKEEVRTALLADQEKLMLVPDPYGSGKEMGAVGRLALIADELGEDQVAQGLRKRLATKLEEWLSGKGKDPLTYDPTYGGIVSTMGLADRAADFGGGWYNDHHFHYGYFLYAAAAVGRKDKAWLNKWAPAISHLIRDIANPTSEDPLYPVHRFKDWYVGHSWASGIFPSASGRNQESISEALNAWYGLALYGEALGDASLRDLGRLMLATEMRSGWKYWQILDPSTSIYPPIFAKNGLAAVVWSTKVDKVTWFGPNVEYAYGIQAMPVTPITEAWLRPEWLTATQSIWGRAMDTATEQWRGILLMMAAVNQPDDAWKNAHLLQLFDNGNTLTNVLYWIATRPTPGTKASADDAPLAEPPSPPLKHPDSTAGAEADAPQEDAPGMPVILKCLMAGGVVYLAIRLWQRCRASAGTTPEPVGDAQSAADYHRV